jgi:ATP-dependent helicase HrpA
VRDTGQVAAWERVSLGQLDLIDRRRVPYGPVNPADARVVFLRGALVEEQLGVEAEFLRQNRQVRQQVEAWAQARRRSDLLADADAVYRFYDARVPERVHSRPDFERWRREVEARDPSALRLKREHLVAETSDDAAFPCELMLSGSVVPVRYAHAPGTDTDGMTIRLPLVKLPELDPDMLEWSVPGQRTELVEALIRSLPRRVRARFQPVEEFASGFLQAVGPERGSLRSCLAAHLSAASGLEIHPEDFEMATVPSHLRPRVELVEGAQALAASRDLDALRAAWTVRARDAIEACMRRHEGGRWCGVATAGWPAFAADLPRALQVEADGATFQVHGSIEVGPDGIRTCWHADPAAALASLRRACLHLCLRAVQGEVRHHLDFDPGYRPLEWSARGLGSPAGLVQLASLLTVSLAWPDSHATPRDEVQWIALMDAIRPRLFEASHRVLAWMDAASKATERLEQELARPAPTDWGATIASAREDRAWLLETGRLESLDAHRLMRVPILLGACTDRLRRLAGGGAPAVVQALAGFDDWLGRANASAPRGASASGWLEFQWLVRESRLGIFAREGAPWPRVRDLEAAWSALSRPPTA